MGRLLNNSSIRTQIPVGAQVSFGTCLYLDWNHTVVITQAFQQVFISARSVSHPHSSFFAFPQPFSDSTFFRGTLELDSHGPKIFLWDFDWNNLKLPTDLGLTSYKALLGALPATWCCPLQRKYRPVLPLHAAFPSLHPAYGSRASRKDRFVLILGLISVLPPDDTWILT